MMFTRSGDSKLESFVGANSTLKGDISVKGTLRVDGNVVGYIKADCVIFGETAYLKGDITARKIIIGGKVEGNLTAKELIEITAKGMVLGDVLTKKISITEGGTYNGKISMEISESKVVEFQPKEG